MSNFSKLSKPFQITHPAFYYVSFDSGGNPVQKVFGPFELIIALTLYPEGVFYEPTLEIPEDADFVRYMLNHDEIKAAINKAIPILDTKSMFPRPTRVNYLTIN